MWTMSSLAEITDDGIVDRALSSPFFPKCVEAYREYPIFKQKLFSLAMHFYQNAQFPLFYTPRNKLQEFRTDCEDLHVT